MDIKNVAIIVFDEKENFEKTKSQIADERQVKSLICVNSLAEFSAVINNLNDSDYVCLVVHVFYTQKIIGAINYKSSRIKKVYPLIHAMYVSEGVADDIKHDMLDQKIEVDEVFKYHQIIDNIENDVFKFYTKKELLLNPEEKYNKIPQVVNYPEEKFIHIKYALITALSEEFKEVKEFVDFPDDEHIIIGNTKFLTGYLKENKKIKLIASIPPETGMIDAAIISTLMLEYFTPDYLLMSGVCGGYYNINIGDIVVAKSVFTFQKGKISDLNTKDENGIITKIELYDKNKQIVDYDHLYDVNGNQIAISIEKFEREQEHIKLEHIKTALELKKEEIEKSINDTIKGFNTEKKEDLQIHIEPMACSTMVINKDGFFEDTIKCVDRKTVAVEMESYGLARACEIANKGNTKAIIFKSVMDNTRIKDDNAKRFAARTSALFLREMFLKGII